MCVCVCVRVSAHIAVSETEWEREKEENRDGEREGGEKRRDQRTLFWHSWCLNVLFFSTTLLLFFPFSPLEGSVLILY